MSNTDKRVYQTPKQKFKKFDDKVYKTQEGIEKTRFQRFHDLGFTTFNTFREDIYSRKKGRTMPSKKLAGGVKGIAYFTKTMTI